MFHKDPKLDLTIMESRQASLKIFCESYFKKHKMLIRIIRISIIKEI